MIQIEDVNMRNSTRAMIQNFNKWVAQSGILLGKKEEKGPLTDSELKNGR